MSAGSVFRSIYLTKSRPSQDVRWNFGLMVPNSGYIRTDIDLGSDKHKFIGTMIHVVGSPITGYRLEFQRNINANSRPNDLKEVIRIGRIHTALVVDPTGAPMTSSSRVIVEDTRRCPLETIAAKVPVPGKSESFMEPVNDVRVALEVAETLLTAIKTTNRRCQEWTMDLVQLLVSRGYLDAKAADIVQSHRDAPEFGIGFIPVGAS